MTDKFDPNQDFPDNYAAYHALGMHLMQSADAGRRRHGTFIRDVVAHFVVWLGQQKQLAVDPRDLLLSASEGMAGMAHVLRLNYQLSEDDNEQLLADVLISVILYYHKNSDDPFAAARRTAAMLEQSLRKTRA